jgi:hypothetical protein
MAKQTPTNVYGDCVIAYVQFGVDVLGSGVVMQSAERQKADPAVVWALYKAAKELFKAGEGALCARQRYRRLFIREVDLRFRAFCCCHNARIGVELPCSAYRSIETEARLKENGYKSRIHRRGARNRPLVAAPAGRQHHALEGARSRRTRLRRPGECHERQVRAHHRDGASLREDRYDEPGLQYASSCLARAGGGRARLSCVHGWSLCCVA